MIASPILLTDEPPLFVLPGLAAKLLPTLRTRAASAAVFLQQIHYYLGLGRGRVSGEGVRYVYHTAADWRKKIPWLTEWDFRKIVEQLIELGLIKVEAFNNSGRDRTRHYTINYGHKWLTSIYSNFSNATEDKNSDAFETALSHTDTTPDIAPNISFPPNPPGEPEREREDLGSTPESAEIDWDAIRTQMNQSHSLSLLEQNSHLTSSLVEEPPKFEIELKDPWLDESRGATLLNDEKKKQVDLTSDSHYPKLYNLFADECRRAESSVRRTLVHVERKQEKGGVSGGKASPSEPPLRSERLQSDVSPRPFMKRRKYVWEVEPGKPIPEFQNWWAKTHYEPQGGHWATGAYGHAYSEFYNKPEKTTNAIFPAFMAVHQVVAQNCQQQQSIGQQGVLPSYFALPPAPSEDNMHQLATTFRELVSNGARVALPQGIATPSCQQSVSWNSAQRTVIAPLPELHYASHKFLFQKREESLADQVERKRLAWKTPFLRSDIKKWVEATDGVELDDDGPCLV